MLLECCKYIEDITRRREAMNFMFEWQEQYLTSERSEREYPLDRKCFAVKKLQTEMQKY